MVEHAAARDAGLLERVGVTVVPSARRRRERVDADDVLDALTLALAGLPAIAFLSADTRLADAAEIEGLTVLR